MSNIDRAREEAAMWLVLLDDDPADAGRRREFEAWLQAAPVNREAWQGIGRTAALIERAVPLETPAPAAAAPVHLLRPPPPRRLPRALAATAVALAACLLIAVVGPSLSVRLRADHLTAVAETRTLRLDDGSSVRLGPDSALQVAFSTGERRVELLAGEALFEVTPNASRPFRVVTRDAITTVLGTRFDVAQLDRSTSIAVGHGHVQVSYRGSGPAVDLLAGDWVRMSADGATERGENPPELPLEPDHRIGVRNRPVAEVVERIRPWFSGRIVIADTEVGRRSVTGVFDAADPARALEALVGPQGGRVIRITPWLLIVSRS